MPCDLATLQPVQVLLKFQKVLVGIHFFDCCASQQLHKDVGLYVSLGVGHGKVDRPHVLPQQQGHDENTPNNCPRDNRGKCHPAGVAKHLAVASSTQTGLPLQDFSCRIPFALEGPYHGKRFGGLRDLRRVDDLPVFQFGMLAQLLCHGINKFILVWLLHCHIEWHCIGIPIRLGDSGCKCLEAGKQVEVQDGLNTGLGHGFAVVSCISKPGRSADLAASSGVSQGRNNDWWVV